MVTPERRRSVPVTPRKPVPSRLLPFVVLALLHAAPAAVRAETPCAEDGRNLLAEEDCAFAKGIGGWAPAGDDGTHVAHEPEGASKPGALSVTGNEGSAIVVGPCLRVKGGAPHEARARLRLAGGEVYACTLTGRQYTDGACADGRELLELSVIVNPGADWQTAQGSVTSGEEFGSLRLHLECNGEPGFRVLLDDVVFTR